MSQVDVDWIPACNTDYLCDLGHAFLTSLNLIVLSLSNKDIDISSFRRVMKIRTNAQ